MQERGGFATEQCASTPAVATPTTPNPKVAKRDYTGEIDYFAVYCRDTGGVYLVPIDEVPVKRQGALRVEPARNKQFRFIRLARDYEIGRIQVTTNSVVAGYRELLQALL